MKTSLASILLCGSLLTGCGITARHDAVQADYRAQHTQAMAQSRACQTQGDYDCARYWLGIADRAQAQAKAEDDQYREILLGAVENMKRNIERNSYVPPPIVYVPPRQPLHCTTIGNQTNCY